MKICSECQIEKPISEFYVDKRWNIPRSKCKSCCNKRSIENRKKNPPKLDPEKARARRKRWEDKNPEWRKEYGPKYYMDNKEKVDERRRKWMQRNPEKVAAWNHKRRARTSMSEIHFTGQEFKDLCESYGNICLKCGSVKKLTPDHVVPLSKGGSNGIENIQPLCRHCNAVKHVAVEDYRFRTCEIPKGR